MKNLYAATFLVVSVFCCSCKKKPKPDVIPGIPEIYVAAVTQGPPYGLGYPFYWKDDMIVRLPTTKEDGSLNAVFGSENDIYAAGSAWLGPTSFGQYWKNGVHFEVDGGLPSSELFDIAVSGSDVHVSGDAYHKIIGKQAGYWKNGVSVTLDEASERPSRARKIFVVGKDAYVAGSVLYGNNTAVYWKNGKLVVVGNRQINSNAISVAVSGQDVHVVGNETINYRYRAKYWKNGVGTLLTNGSEFNSEAVDVAVSGKDVYCVGTVYDGKVTVATVWKNGVAQSLPMGLHAHSVCIFNNDVYVAGEGMMDATKVGMYWRNGVPVKLPDGDKVYSVSSIFVKSK